MMAMEFMEKWALHAYADGQLGLEDAREVEKMLSENEDARKLVADIRHQKSALRKALDPTIGEDIPSPLLRAIAGHRKPPAWPRWAVAASLATLLVGGGSGWIAHNLASPGSAVAQTLPQRALDAFAVYGADANHVVEVSGTDKEQLHAWLTKRIGVEFALPDLTAMGYSLMGGRLLAEGDKPAGLLFYENDRKQRLAVYVAANTANTNEPMTVQHRGTLVTCYWVEPDLVYALAGEQPVKEMLPLAEAAHEGFDKEG